MSVKPPSVVERLLADGIGLDPSSVGSGLIARGVHQRMNALGLKSIAEYERVLIDQPGEIQELVEEVVVPESWFFRDEKPFEVLGQFAQAWLIDPSRPPLTALSVPCASGEEPYSIAITLLEAGLAADRFRVDAVDVAARPLSRAIAGVYGSNAFRGMASERRSSYFREQNGSFTLNLAVRSTVKFRLGNLLDPGLFADRGPFDVVFCRNLLIYLDDVANARAFEALTRLVAEDGLLFLGHADRLEWIEKSPFEPVAEKGAFAYRKQSSRRVGLALPITPGRQGKPYPTEEDLRSLKVAPGATSPQPGPPPQGGRGSDVLLPPSGPLPPCGGGLGWGVARPDQKTAELGRSRATGSAATPHPGPPPQGGREAERTIPDSVISLLDRASSLADSGQYLEARALVEQILSTDNSSARAYFLLGMIEQAAGLRQRAEEHYLKAIYLDPQHDEALLALALLARRKGDVAAESSYRRRAERVRSRKVVP